MIELKAVSRFLRRGKAERSHPKDKRSVGKGGGRVKIRVLESPTCSYLLVLHGELGLEGIRFPVLVKQYLLLPQLSASLGSKKLTFQGTGRDQASRAVFPP